MHLFSNTKKKSLELLFVSNLARCLMDGTLQSRTLWASSNRVRPGVIASTNRIELPFFCSCTFPCLWFPSIAFSPGRPFLSLLYQPLYRQMCLFFHLPDPPPPKSSQVLPFEVSITDTITFVSLASPLSALKLLLSLTPLVTSAAPTIQRVLNRNALDITSVCLLSTQSVHTAIFWFVGEGARVNKLAQNSLNDSALTN